MLNTYTTIGPQTAHSPPEDRQQRVVDAVAVEDIEVVPGTLCGKVVEVEANGGVGLAGVYEPCALGVCGVVPRAVCDHTGVVS